jgi:hypothetical protein
VEPPGADNTTRRFTLQAARARRQHRPPPPASDPAATDLLVREVGYGQRDDIHEAFLTLAGAIIC